MVLLPGCPCCQTTCAAKPLPESVEVDLSQPITGTFNAHFLHRRRGWNGPYQTFDETTEWFFNTSIVPATGTYSLTRNAGTNTYSFSGQYLLISVTLWEDHWRGLRSLVGLRFYIPSTVQRVPQGVHPEPQSSSAHVDLQLELFCLANNVPQYVPDISWGGGRCPWLSCMSLLGDCCIVSMTYMSDDNGWGAYIPPSGYQRTQLHPECRLPQTSSVTHALTYRAGIDDVSEQPPYAITASNMNILSSSYPVMAQRPTNFDNFSTTRDFAFGVTLTPSIDAVRLIYEDTITDYFTSFGLSACA